MRSELERITELPIKSFTAHLWKWRGWGVEDQEESCWDVTDDEGDAGYKDCHRHVHLLLPPPLEPLSPVAAEEVIVRGSAVGYVVFIHFGPGREQRGRGWSGLAEGCFVNSLFRRKLFKKTHPPAGSRSFDYVIGFDGRTFSQNFIFRLSIFSDDHDVAEWYDQIRKADADYLYGYFVWSRQYRAGSWKSIENFL